LSKKTRNLAIKGNSILSLEQLEKSHNHWKNTINLDVEYIDEIRDFNIEKILRLDRYHLIDWML